MLTHSLYDLLKGEEKEEVDNGKRQSTEDEKSNLTKPKLHN